MANVPTQPPGNPRTILLVGDLAKVPLEGRAGGVIKPGYLIKPTTATKHPYLTYIAHATAGGRCPPVLALEKGWIGDPIDSGVGGGTVDDNYATGAFIRPHLCMRGDEVWVLVPAAAAAIVLTDRLASNGDGTFKKANGTTDAEILEPLEALDNSAGGAQARIRARVI